MKLTKLNTKHSQLVGLVGRFATAALVGLGGGEFGDMCITTPEL